MGETKGRSGNTGVEIEGDMMDINPNRMVTCRVATNTVVMIGDSQGENEVAASKRSANTNGHK